MEPGFLFLFFRGIIILNDGGGQGDSPETGCAGLANAQMFR